MNLTCLSFRSSVKWAQPMCFKSWISPLRSPSLAVCSQSTRWGSDGGWARILGTTADSVEVAIDEDQSCDSERSHTTEEVSAMAVRRPVACLRRL